MVGALERGRRAAEPLQLGFDVHVPVGVVFDG